MFLSSGQVGYSKKQQRPDSMDAILFVPAITLTADHPFASLSHAMSTQCSRRSCRIDLVRLGFTWHIFYLQFELEVEKRPYRLRNDED